MTPSQDSDLPLALRYYSMLDTSGYGYAGLAHVRGLVRAGVDVHWIPCMHLGSKVMPVPPGVVPPLLEAAGGDETLKDLPRLIEATARPITTRNIVVHTVPEMWQIGFQPGCRNIGFAAWESDLLPPHWTPIFNRASTVCMPCGANLQAALRSSVTTPVHVVPHMARSLWNQIEPAQLDEFRQQLEIPSNHFIFYSINSWDPRKNPLGLLHAFFEAFTADDPVTLILKTGERGYGPPPFYPMQPTEQLMQMAIASLPSALRERAPNVCLLPYELNGQGIDMLHAMGDCFISLSHGEGWGMGACDAASLGRPVIMTGWSGPLDFMGQDWKGKVPVGMAQVPIFPPDAPSFWPPQRWAVPDQSAAVALMRSVFADPTPWLKEADQVRQRIQQRFPERDVIQKLLDVIQLN
ncbi:MAG: glycosyltransferase family 1 protein [Cupriavidus sp.]|nr:MAG: glycosyltransferase family 1 protein [Cupriavidus sp.]